MYGLSTSNVAFYLAMPRVACDDTGPRRFYTYLSNHAFREIDQKIYHVYCMWA
jgi:hypothetical protein